MNVYNFPDMVTQLFTIFISAFIMALSGALMPGPLFTVTVAYASRRGYIAAPMLILGHGILELALIIGVVFGLGGIIKQSIVMATIALLGGCILLWMGSSMIRSSSNASLETENDKSILQMNPVISGILASVSNPYWTIWWATIGLGYLMSSLKFGWLGVTAFFIGHISADFLWYLLVAWSISKGRKIMSQKSYQWAIRICGMFLIGFGGWFLGSSFLYFKN